MGTHRPDPGTGGRTGWRQGAWCDVKFGLPIKCNISIRQIMITNKGSRNKENKHDVCGTWPTLAWCIRLAPRFHICLDLVELKIVNLAFRILMHTKTCACCNIVLDGNRKEQCASGNKCTILTSKCIYKYIYLYVLICLCMYGYIHTYLYTSLYK